MKIQIISNDSLTFETRHEVVSSSFKEPKSLDAYDINIISLQDKDIWVHNGQNYGRINSINHFRSIKEILENSNSTKTGLLTIDAFYEKSEKVDNSVYQM